MSDVERLAVRANDVADKAQEKWSPARIFMLISALYHLPLGIAGLLYDQTFPIGAADAEHAGSDHIFGIFETNGWHSLAALALGVVSVYFLMQPRRARDAALVIGVLHVGIVVAFFAWPPETFWFASNTADQIVHSFTAIGGIGAAVLSRDTHSAETA